MLQDEREVMPSNSEAVAAVASAATTTSHGIEVAVEFKPVEHPIEPLDSDRPIQCPLPEPSILNVRLISDCLMVYGKIDHLNFGMMHACSLQYSN